MANPETLQVVKKASPVYSLQFVLHPEQDSRYRHFEYYATNPFEPDPIGFPKVNVWWLAEAALLAYWNPDTAIPVFLAAGLQAEFIEASGTECYVATGPDFVMVAFRGTQPDEWSDIGADADIILVPWQYGMVHLGFRTAFEAVWPDLQAILENVGPGRTVWFCGHSLGAAIATLAASSYSATRGVCTFGSPRVGDEVFADSFNQQLSGKSLRYVNGNDCVPDVPLPILYRHVDQVRLVGGSNSSGLEHMPKAYAVLTWNDYAGCVVKGT